MTRGQCLKCSFPPVQMAVTQMRKKLEELKELVSEAEDVFRQMEAVKRQITARTSECFESLKEIQDSLHSLGGSDVVTTRAELKVTDYNHSQG